MGSTVHKILIAGALGLGMTGFLGDLFNGLARAEDAPPAASQTADKDAARQQVAAYEKAKLWTPALKSEGAVHTISTVAPLAGLDGKKLEAAIYLTANITDGKTGAALSRSVSGERQAMLDALFCLAKAMDAQIKAGDFTADSLGKSDQGIPSLMLTQDMRNALQEKANEQLGLIGSAVRVDLPKDASKMWEFHSFPNVLGREGFHIPAAGDVDVRIELAPLYRSSLPKNSPSIRETNGNAASSFLYHAFMDRLKGRSAEEIQKMMKDIRVMDEMEDAANREMKASGLPGKIIFDRRTINLSVPRPFKEVAPSAPAP